MITKRDVAVGLLAVTATLGARAAMDSQVIGESVWDWNKMVAKQTPVGESRQIVKGPTTTLDELEMHVTTLNPGVASHPPHHHPNEELVIIDKGTVEALINGSWVKVGPGSVVLNASNVEHAMRNVGDTPAQYHVVNWRTDKTPKQ
jgi:XRE family transcriptional regulator, regulator of sulfur utilization